MIPLSERITLELRHRNPYEVTELILDTSKSDKIEGLTDEYVNLVELSLVNVGLKSLIGFPKLPNLEKLDLSDNRISGDLQYLKHCPKLTQLLLTSNRITNIDSLLPLAELPALEVVDLGNCDVTECENYREKVFELLPQLIYLDGFDQNESEESYSDDYDDDDFEDHNDELSSDFPVSRGKFNHYESAKNGKYRNYQEHYENEENFALDTLFGEEEEEEEEENENNIIEEYNGGKINGDERPVFENYSTYYFEESDDEEEVEEEDRYCPPPPHGSKFRPLDDGQMIRRCTAKKRSCSSTDEYEAAKKIFILGDSTAFVPSFD